MRPLLSIQHMKVRADGKQIIRDFSLTMNPGEMHVLMGPNGSGKSTVAQALAGHLSYTVHADELSFAGKNLKKLTADQRARLGIFLGFQYPLAISGVSLGTLLPEAIRAVHGKTATPKKNLIYPTLASKMAIEKRERISELQKNVTAHLAALGLSQDILFRNLNEGFSGGEKKKSEIVQMLVLKPKLAILDEPDSGLDVDALKTIAGAINKAHRHGMAILLITHYQRILKYLRPDKVHILSNGIIVRSGTAALAQQIESKGYVEATR